MMSDPESFTSQELGKHIDEYVKWITSGSAAWGGIPELKALALFYECEFAVVVIEDIEVLLFGKGKSYKKRVYVLYDGTHYNLIRSGSKKIFEPSDEQAYQGCLVLAEQCNKANEALDPSVFSLVCYQCQTRLVGQFDAVEHA